MRILVTIAAMLLSIGTVKPVNAEIIAGNGYSLNTDTRMVTGGGLSWLQWRETEGMTVADALALYPQLRLASAAEIDYLIEDFGFERTFVRGIGLVEIDDAGEPVKGFNDLFGSFCNLGRPCAENEYYTSALYGDPAGPYGVFSVFSPFEVVPGVEVGVVHATGPLLASSGLEFYGVALVSEVPLPAAAWFLGTALLGLGLTGARAARRGGNGRPPYSST